MKQFKASTEFYHRWFVELHSRIAQSCREEIRYIDLGVKTLRVLCYDPGFLPLMEKQLSWSLKDSAQHYDATLVIWKEMDMTAKDQELVQGFDLDGRQVLSINETAGILHAYDAVEETYYYAANDLRPEEFIKQGHIFVKVLYDLLKTPNSSLVHGACVGINGKGVLFCARGQRGKSTLSVLAMLEGFEYVSDDYLVLEKDEDGLWAYPIYSIITLSPTMYNELYDELEGTRFVSNNARRDKYVINIANLHDRFRTRYPVHACMFPEIVSDPEPSITSIDGLGKGRAITQLAHSTMMQMNDLHDPATTRKLMSMVSDKPYYQIRLCRDIHANVEKLRQFINTL